MTALLPKKPAVILVTNRISAKGEGAKRSKLERHFEIILLSPDVRKLFPLLAKRFLVEHKFCDSDVDGKARRWRFDFCWPVYGRNHEITGGVALEIQGGIYGNSNRGAHVRGPQYELDAEKYNTAVWQGWAVYLATAKMIRKEPMKLLHMLNDSLIHLIEGDHGNG